MALFTDIVTFISAIFAGDLWEMKSAIQTPGVWFLFLILLLATALAFQKLYRKFTWAERNLERYIMVISYLSIGGIIFIEVIKRFVFSVQAPWSTTLPPFLFMIMAWFGCSYNVKLRTHLAFSEVRVALSRQYQFALLCLDTVLWIGFSWIVVATSIRVVINSASNFQIMLGTDNVMQWWFLLAVPLSFTCLTARTLENFFVDIENYKTGKPLIKQVAIGQGE